MESEKRSNRYRYRNHKDLTHKGRKGQMQMFKTKFQKPNVKQNNRSVRQGQKKVLMKKKYLQGFHLF